MKVIFLDIDGVLYTFPLAKDPYDHDTLNKIPCLNLQFLLDKMSDLKIVISSSWRHNGLDFMKDYLKDYGINPLRVIDITGYERFDGKNHRGHQIDCWLKRHPEVTQFVILDDESDIEPHKDHWVKTNKFIGLTEANVEKAIDILEKKS